VTEVTTSATREPFFRNCVAVHTLRSIGGLNLLLRERSICADCQFAARVATGELPEPALDGGGEILGLPSALSSSGCRSGHQLVSPGDYVADTVLSGAGAAVSLRGGDGFIGRRPKRRTVSTHAERSRPSRSRIGDTVEGMRPRLPFTS
jgi:hypothetical protein